MKMKNERAQALSLVGFSMTQSLFQICLVTQSQISRFTFLSHSVRRQLPNSLQMAAAPTSLFTVEVVSLKPKTTTGMILTTGSHTFVVTKPIIRDPVEFFEPESVAPANAVAAPAGKFDGVWFDSKHMIFMYLNLQPDGYTPDESRAAQIKAIEEEWSALGSVIECAKLNFDTSKPNEVRGRCRSRRRRSLGSRTRAVSICAMAAPFGS
jgi:hypothetical protein